MITLADLISDSKPLRAVGLPRLAPKGAGGSRGEMGGSLLVPAASGPSEQVSWLRAPAPSFPLRRLAQKVAPRGRSCSAENEILPNVRSNQAGLREAMQTDAAGGVGLKGGSWSLVSVSWLFGFYEVGRVYNDRLLKTKAQGPGRSSDGGCRALGPVNFSAVCASPLSPSSWAWLLATALKSYLRGDSPPGRAPPCGPALPCLRRR